jgi:Holliday junction resolvasome RuvABC endonuclease subunit
MTAPKTRLNVIGFDVSTKNVYFGIYDGHDFLEVDRLHNHHQLGYLKAKHGIHVAYCEEIPFVNNHRVAIKLGEAVGRVQAHLEMNGIRYRMVPVALWKQLSVGSGRAVKRDVKDFIVKFHKVSAKYPQDAYDACGVAIAGWCLEKEQRMCDGRYRAAEPETKPTRKEDVPPSKPSKKKGEKDD